MWRLVYLMLAFDPDAHDAMDRGEEMHVTREACALAVDELAIARHSVLQAWCEPEDLPTPAPAGRSWPPLAERSN